MDTEDERIKSALSRVRAGEPDTVREQAEAEDPAFVAHFEKMTDWENPRYVRLTGGDRICARCGAVVHTASKSVHTAYHRNLSFALNLASAAAKADLTKSGVQGQMSLEQKTPV